MIPRPGSRSAPPPYWRLFGLTAASHAPVQKRVACFLIVTRCLAAAAATGPRARPSAEFAALSHMLMNGFFLVQRFFIETTSNAS
jgi:hypothetical protein